MKKLIVGRVVPCSKEPLQNYNELVEHIIIKFRKLVNYTELLHYDQQCTSDHFESHNISLRLSIVTPRRAQFQHFSELFQFRSQRLIFLRANELQTTHVWWCFSIGTF
jgi:hypothetical protein